MMLSTDETASVHSLLFSNSLVRGANFSYGPAETMGTCAEISDVDLDRFFLPGSAAAQTFDNH